MEQNETPNEFQDNAKDSAGYEQSATPQSEMLQNEKDISDYQRGFNEGYIIAENAPEIGETLSHLQADSERLDGIRYGIAEYKIEYEKENYPSFLRSDRFDATEKGQDKSKDKGSPQMEKD